MKKLVLLMVLLGLSLNLVHADPKKLGDQGEEECCENCPDNQNENLIPVDPEGKPIIKPKEGNEV